MLGTGKPVALWRYETTSLLTVQLYTLFACTSICVCWPDLRVDAVFLMILAWWAMASKSIVHILVFVSCLPSNDIDGD